MNIVFWNIGKSLTDRKLEWVERLIACKIPDIYCIAEGPESIEATQNLMKRIELTGYRCYYSPVFYQEPVIDKRYDWNRCGLKVFVRNGVKLKTKFTFPNQKEDGRIVYLLFEQNGKNYSVFLIHGTSKSQTPMRQNAFIVELSNFIRAKMLNKDGGVVILGDFNLEPWDNSLKDGKYIESYSSSKAFNYFSFKEPQKRIYNNPIVRYVEEHPNPDLIGTFYKGKHISLLDFALLSRDVDNFELEVVAEINGTSILVKSNKKHVLVDELDHLPVSLKIR